MAIREAAERRDRGVPHKLVGRAARLLGCSPTLVRNWIRRDPAVRAAKLEADEAWRATVDENLRRARLLHSGRTREILEGAEQADFNSRFCVDFGLLEETTKGFARRLHT